MASGRAGHETYRGSDAAVGCSIAMSVTMSYMLLVG
jgi:hypothetical protein